MANVLLLIGGNMGDVQHFIDLTHLAIEKQMGNIVVCSSLYESEPWGFSSEQNFINQVIEIETQLKPLQLLAVAKNIEKELGRQPKQSEGYEARVMDIDILFYNDEVINLPHLVIPHPQIANRRFTLLPLSEKWSLKLHPLLKKNMAELLLLCADRGKVNRLIK